MTDLHTSDPSALPANNRQALRQVVRSCRKAALATLMAGEDVAMPYASLVTVAVDHDLAPLLLLSGISDHTKNIVADPRVSLLFDGTEGHANPQTGPRVTLSGIAEPTTDDRLRARFLSHHPAAARYADFGDFSLWRVRPDRAHFVGGFGRAVWFDAPFGLDEVERARLIADEPGIVAHMNSDHAEAINLLADAPADGGWRMVGIDVDGCDLAGESAWRRIDFASPLVGPGAARATLVELVDRARA